MQQNHDPENAVSVSTNGGNSITLTGQQPLTIISEMTDNFENTVEPTVVDDYTRDAGTSNPAVLVSDETGALEHSEPTPPLGVEQTNTDGSNKTSAPPSGTSDSMPTHRKRGRPKGWRKTLPATSSDEVGHPPVPKPADSILSLGLSGVGIGKVNTNDNNIDMFAPENLRVSQDFVNEAAVEQIHGTIPVRKPNQKEFVRVRPGEDWQLSVAIIEDTDREVWIVKPDIIAGVFDEVSYVLLRLAVNRHGVPFLWALKLPKDGKRNLWNDTALAAAEHATRRWVRVKSDMQAGQYTIMAAKTDFGKPKWLDMSFQDVLQLAFKDRIIADNDHPILKQLRGEI